MTELAGNFPGKDGNKLCKMCHLFYEVQEHLMNCYNIRRELICDIDFKFSYSDIEGPLAKQEEFAKKYTLILTTRERLLKENSSNEVQSTGRVASQFQVATNRNDGV